MLGNTSYKDTFIGIVEVFEHLSMLNILLKVKFREYFTILASSYILRDSNTLKLLEQWYHILISTLQPITKITWHHQMMIQIWGVNSS